VRSRSQIRHKALNAALCILKDAGIAPDVWRGGKHFRAEWVNPQGVRRSVTISVSGNSDAIHYVRGDVRRILRADGINV
jgi:hypothetical protein